MWQVKVGVYSSYYRYVKPERLKINTFYFAYRSLFCRILSLFKSLERSLCAGRTCGYIGAIHTVAEVTVEAGKSIQLF